jgi:hypothetical protein
MISDLFRIRLNTVLGEYQSPAYITLGQQPHLMDLPPLPLESVAGVPIEPIAVTAPHVQ